jgi:hypothetical protein
MAEHVALCMEYTPSRCETLARLREESATTVDYEEAK